MRRRLASALCLAVVCSGCAHRSVRSWQLVNAGRNQVLVPPDVRDASVAQREFSVDLAPRHGPCATAAGPLAIRVHKRRADVSVGRDALAQQPVGWLASWALDLEQQGCIPVGDGTKLAERVVDSVPLDPAAFSRLLYAAEVQQGQITMGAHAGLQVVSPSWRRPDVGLMAGGPYSITGHGHSLTVTGKSTENIVGYEKAFYAIRPRPHGAGYTIVPLGAEKHIETNIERLPQPTTNYLQFPSDAAFFRLFYKADQTDFTALVVGARTPAELGKRVDQLRAGGASASCTTLNDDMCRAIPHDVAVNPVISVTVNGNEVFVGRGANLSNAIVTAGERQPESVVPTLTVLRPWNDRLMPVLFDHADVGILKLAMKGGEVIAWRRSARQ